MREGIGFDFWKIHRLADPRFQGAWLAERLTVELVNPLSGAVGRDDDERLVLIMSLGHSGSHIEQCRTAGDADHDGLVGGLSNAECEEPC